MEKRKKRTSPDNKKTKSNPPIDQASPLTENNTPGWLIILGSAIASIASASFFLWGIIEIERSTVFSVIVSGACLIGLVLSVVFLVTIIVQLAKKKPLEEKPRSVLERGKVFAGILVFLLVILASLAPPFLIKSSSDLLAAAFCAVSLVVLVIIIFLVNKNTEKETKLSSAITVLCASMAALYVAVGTVFTADLVSRLLQEHTYLPIVLPAVWVAILVIVIKTMPKFKELKGESETEGDTSEKPSLRSFASRGATSVVFSMFLVFFILWIYSFLIILLAIVMASLSLAAGL